jgi:hypothetical protein
MSFGQTMFGQKNLKRRLVKQSLVERRYPQKDIIPETMFGQTMLALT